VCRLKEDTGDAWARTRGEDTGRGTPGRGPPADCTPSPPLACPARVCEATTVTVLSGQRPRCLGPSDDAPSPPPTLLAQSVVHTEGQVSSVSARRDTDQLAVKHTMDGRTRGRRGPAIPAGSTSMCTAGLALGEPVGPGTNPARFVRVILFSAG
jgi:hypothetical protein